MLNLNAMHSVLFEFLEYDIIQELVIGDLMKAGYEEWRAREVVDIFNYMNERR